MVGTRHIEGWQLSVENAGSIRPPILSADVDGSPFNAQPLHFEA